jgi:hypothetical protein
MRLPTGREIAAARALAGFGQIELAREAKINQGTLSRVETSPGVVRGQGRSIQAVLDALLRHGVLITDNGVERVVGGKR